jgi:hypothetical protein
MLIMYRGFELVPVKECEAWQAKVFSGGRQIAVTMPVSGEDVAITEARKIADRIRGPRRSVQP